MAKCGTCTHWVRIGVERRGYCHGLPPIVLPSGYQKRGELKEDERGCSLHEEGEQSVKQKTNPDTVGKALKAARQSGQRRD